MNARTFVLCCAAALPSAYGQTWVSASAGSDTNSCTRSLPCKTFAHVVTVTPAWGQVNVLDPGDYGSVTITQSMTIDGGGFASNVTTSGAAITVTAPNAVVQLRNLSIHGNGASGGIVLTSASQLHIENVKVNGIGGSCISATLNGSGNTDLVIKDSSIDNCSVAGIYLLEPGSAVLVTAEIINTQVHFANYGLVAYATGTITIFGSTFSSPTEAGSQIGIAANTSINSPFIILDNCQVSGFQAGIDSTSASIVQINRSTFTNNGTALETADSGQIISNGNNSFAKNGTNGAPTKTVSLF
jgi:hypothetical protein